MCAGVGEDTLPDSDSQRRVPHIPESVTHTHKDRQNRKVTTERERENER